MNGETLFGFKIAFEPAGPRKGAKTFLYMLPSRRGVDR